MTLTHRYDPVGMLGTADVLASWRNPRDASTKEEEGVESERESIIKGTLEYVLCACVYMLLILSVLCYVVSLCDDTCD